MHSNSLVAVLPAERNRSMADEFEDDVELDGPFFAGVRRILNLYNRIRKLGKQQQPTTT